MRALDIAATGMQAQQLNVEVIANNIANVNTTGYKRQRAEFQDLLYQTVIRPGTQSSDSGTIVPSGIQLGAGVKAAAVYRINEQGNISQTSNALDVAINGTGYFQVELPDGETAYTRDGSFQLNATGELVTADGYIVKPGLTVPSGTTNITINSAGSVYAVQQGQTTPTLVGQFQLASFPNVNGLSAQGSNYFLQTQASGAAVTGNPAQTGFGTILQGDVETSNVDIVSEMTNLITAQRAYEMNSKVVKTGDEMLQTLGQLKS
jgi:flagellar basal-body rod protein FlgG